jgi:hypothetical protein
VGVELAPPLPEEPLAGLPLPPLEAEPFAEPPEPPPLASASVDSEVLATRAVITSTHVFEVMSASHSKHQFQQREISSEPDLAKRTQ